ncbi:MAG: HAD-IIIC family phosphatase [Lachnospiraceae bacterium]|nr:HAD-IIIC family phosphatase [Lachnospiraceae bacterium]
MYTFHELKKAAKHSEAGNGMRIAVLGNCATQFFSLAIKGYAALENIPVEIFDADYNQIDAQLIDTSSEVYEFKPECIILYIATEKIYEEFLDLPLSQRSAFADDMIAKIENYWNMIAANAHSRIIQPNFTEIEDKALGQYSCKVDSTFTYQIRKLNFLLQEKASQRSDVYPVDLLALQIRLGEHFFFDGSLYYNAKMTVSMDALPYVAGAVVDVIKAMSGRIKKCIICDLDNTLWGGIIGDDGMGGIEIGELGRGHAFTDLQRYLKQLKECGIILAVCSKNNEDTAKEPFEKHEEMVLRLSDISVFVANWDDKASNIKLIQETLNIGMDSIVFLDDNPFERNLIRQMIPEIEVPELPEDPALYLEYLQEMNYFETASFTGVSSDRTSQYQAEFERKQAQKSFESIDDYLKSLEMKGSARPFEEVRFARIAQLTQRSNQFNLRTVRYTEDEIAKIASDDDHLTLYYTLEDKFGDHGLVSVVIMKKESDTTLFVDTWLMSCRVLKRGMEEFIVNKIFETARKNGFEKITAEYIPTAKNAMVKDIYRSFGFTETSENKYEIRISDYKPQEVFIKDVSDESDT